MKLHNVTRDYQRLHKNPVLLWKDILDLGIESCLAFLSRKRNRKEALNELKDSLSRQSEEHWQALYNALRKLR